MITSAIKMFFDVNKVAETIAYFAEFIVACIVAFTTFKNKIQNKDTTTEEPKEPEVIEKVVEKIVEVPVEKIVEVPVEKIVEVPVETVKEKIVYRDVNSGYTVANIKKKRRK